MKINSPLSSKQLKEGNLIPTGVYNFQVVDAAEDVSKAGNDMIKLQLKIWLEDGRERYVFDYLLEALEYKLGHFAEVTGLMDQYNNKTLNAIDCLHKCGSVKIGIKSDKTGQYADQNAVLDYVNTPPGSLLSPIPQQATKDDFINDDQLPF